MAALNVDLGIVWAPKQWRALTFRAPLTADGSPRVETVAVLGEYGGGKTFCAAARFLACCLTTPQEEGDEDPPMSAIVAPTLSDAKAGPYRELKRMAGPAWRDLVVRERLYGEYQDVDLMNGHRIKLYSAAGAMNGPNLCQLWADEIQERVYADAWDNLHGRVRDLRSRWLNCQVSGIAERGHVEAIFRDKPGDDRCTVLLFPGENASNLGAGYVEGLAEATAASRQRDEDGWMLPIGSLYPSFSVARHLAVPPGLPHRRTDLLTRPTTLAVDFGRHAAMIWLQPVSVRVRGAGGVERMDTGALIVDQVMPSDQDAEKLALLAKNWPRKWNVGAAGSVICLDPTTEVDQVRHFKAAFPGTRIIRHERGFYRSEENGMRAVDRALLDGLGNVRLYVHPDLANADPDARLAKLDDRSSSTKGRRGVVQMFNSWVKLKDKWLEHAADVVRYGVQYHVPLPMRPGERRDESADPVTDRTEADRISEQIRGFVG